MLTPIWYKAIIQKDEILVERQLLNAFGTETLTPPDKPERGINYQKDPPDDLKVVSWAKGTQAKDLNYYAYDRNGGQNVVLYVAEEGIDLQNPVSRLSGKHVIDFKRLRNLLLTISLGDMVPMSKRPKKMTIPSTTARPWCQKPWVRIMAFLKVHQWWSSNQPHVRRTQCGQRR